MNTIKIQAGKTLMVAHRGVSGLEKENTTLAFVAAGNRSYFGIESDIHRTADGKFVLIHDSDTNRLAKDVHYVVEETDFDTLRSVHLIDPDGLENREDLRMPTPEEYIRICKKYEKVCVMELKNAMDRATVEKIAEIFRSEGYLDHTIFISFEYEPLVILRELLPDQPIQFLCSTLPDDLVERCKKYRFDVDVRFTALTEEVVRTLHENGIAINCWTVNDPEDAKRLIGWGVDYITSNILEAE